MPRDLRREYIAGLGRVYLYGRNNPTGDATGICYYPAMAKLVEFLTANEIATKLGVSRQRVHQIAVTRQILPVRRIGHMSVFAASDLRLFTAKKKLGRPKKVLTGVKAPA